MTDEHIKHWLENGNIITIKNGNVSFERTLKMLNESTSVGNNAPKWISIDRYKNMNAPKWIAIDLYRNMILPFLQDKDAQNHMENVPEKDRPDFLFQAANIRKRCNNKLSPIQAMQYVSSWKTSSDLYSQSLEADDNYDTKIIMDEIFSMIRKWKDPLKEEIFFSKTIIFTNNITTIDTEDNKKFLRFDMLPKDVQNKLLIWIEWEYWDILRNTVKDFLWKNPWKTPNDSFYNDGIFQLCTKYYNVFNLLNPKKTHLDQESLSNNDKQLSQEDFNGILLHLWFDVSNVDENILRDLEEMDNLIREENERLLEEYKRKNRELNAGYQLKSPLEDTEAGTEVIENIGVENIDMQSWVDIAKNAWLWKELMEEYNNFEHQEEWEYDDQAFSIAWSKFIESHDVLKSYITEDVISNLYDQNSNTIKNLDNWAWDDLKKIFQDHPDEIQKIYNQLLYFPGEVSNTKKELAKNAESKRNIYDENKTNYAIGTVIDDVRDAFSVINKKENIDDKNWNFNWFKLNEELPVEKVWNNIIIRGSFNGSEVKVRYDLETGKLFMNSFLHKLSIDKFNVWDNSLIDLQIGQIKPFNHVLNEYNTPLKSSSYGNSNNEVAKVLDNQMDLIGNTIKDNTQNQAYKNSAIINFMRTFNIVSDSWKSNSLDFNNWSNLFDVIQILDNSDSLSLEYFNNVFMSTVMVYSWLKYWEKNIIQDKKNKKSETIFEYNGDNDNKKYLKDKIENFNSEQFSWIANFNSNHQLWFADLVRLKITSWIKPNWKLDIKKMDNFIKDIEGENESPPNSVI